MFSFVSGFGSKAFFKSYFILFLENKMAHQWSTALSELVLCIFCCGVCYKISDQNKFVCSAIAATATAAFFGIWRFGLRDCPSDVYRWHRFTTRVALTFTPSLLASVYVAQVHSVGSMALLVAPMIVTFVMSEVAPESQEVFMTLLSIGSLFAIVYVSFIQNIVSGIVGAILMIISSILIQGEGSINGIKRVDLFHFLLIPSLYFLVNGAGVNI